MPDDQAMPARVSLTVPSDIVEAFDKLAAALERPREWVMLRALREYFEDGEGREIAEDTENLALVGPGGIRLKPDDLHEKLAKMIERAELRRAAGE